MRKLHSECFDCDEPSQPVRFIARTPRARFIESVHCGSLRRHAHCGSLLKIDLGLWLRVLGFGVWGFRFKASSFGFGVWGLRFKASGFGFGVSGLRFTASVFGFQV